MVRASWREAGLVLCNNPDEWTLAKGKRQIDLVLKRNGLGGRLEIQRMASGTFPTLVDDDKDGQFDDDHRGVWVQARFSAPPPPPPPPPVAHTCPLCGNAHSGVLKTA